ncbi:helix-turn-helix domain-containing protein [Gordonia asplenii]|nr:helix-turn-helix transcriptional regulator [Gordonia asplenii]
MSRRAKVSPAQVGLPAGGRRRVAGLRRQEVATLAGVSPDYYLQIERGRAPGVSAEVLGSIARVLLLDDTELDYLFELAGLPPRRAESSPSTVPTMVQSMIDSMATMPVIVLDPALHIVAGNRLGNALYAEVIERSPHVPNLARFVFRDEAARQFYAEWSAMADHAVSLLRAETARLPGGPADAVVSELMTTSPDFAARWHTHDVARHEVGIKVINHPSAGQLRLAYQGLDIPGGQGLRVFGYTAVADDADTVAGLSRLATDALEIAGL